LIVLFRATGLRTGVAVAAALVWALNFQGINMAVLWISGRTALMVTFWSVAAAWAWSRKRPALAALLAMMAMWSKEEAFVLAPILTVWSMIDGPGRQGGPSKLGDGPSGAHEGPSKLGPYVYRATSAFRDTWMLWAVTAISLVVRSQSGAFTPGSAPSSYQYQLGLTTLLANIPQYVDRAATTPLLALLVFWVATGCPTLAPDLLARRSSVPNVMSEGGKLGLTNSNPLIAPTLLKGLVWVVLGFAPTIFLPVRSSLYALLPSVGVVLIAGVLAGRIVERVPPRACARATAIMLVLLLALLPIYRLRNQRYVGEADLSTAIVTEISQIASAPALTDGLIIIKDVRDARPTAEQAFGPGADRMAELTTGGKFRVWIDPPPAELAGAAPPPISTAVATLVVERGNVRRQ